MFFPIGIYYKASTDWTWHIDTSLRSNRSCAFLGKGKPRNPSRSASERVMFALHSQKRVYLKERFACVVLNNSWTRESGKVKLQISRIDYNIISKVTTDNMLFLFCNCYLIKIPLAFQAGISENGSESKGVKNPKIGQSFSHFFSLPFRCEYTRHYFQCVSRLN